MIEIIDIFSRDLVLSDGSVLEIWNLPNQESVDLDVRVVIGFTGTDYEEVFDTVIATGEIKEKYLSRKVDVPYGGKIFLYEEFDAKIIKADFLRKIAECERPEIDDVIKELSKIMSWDFEDYHIEDAVLNRDTQ